MKKHPQPALKLSLGPNEKASNNRGGRGLEIEERLDEHQIEAQHVMMGGGAPWDANHCTF